MVDLKTTVLLVLVGVTLATDLPFTDPVINSPETQLWNGLSESERQAVMEMAFSLGAKDPLTPALKRFKRSDSKLDDPDIHKLAEKILRYARTKWQLTLEQIIEINLTGKLCDDRGFCIDFRGGWGHNCCPFG